MPLTVKKYEKSKNKKINKVKIAEYIFNAPSSSNKNSDKFIFQRYL